MGFGVGLKPPFADLSNKSEIYVNFRGLTLIHEMLHAFSMPNRNISHREMAEMAMGIAHLSNIMGNGKFDLGKGLPKREDYEPGEKGREAYDYDNSYYFDYLLEQACSLANRPL